MQLSKLTSAAPKCSRIAAFALAESLNPRVMMAVCDRTTLISRLRNIDINANHGNCAVEVLGHGVLLCLCSPLPDLSLAGQEHGRTIPLSEVEWLSLLHRDEVTSSRLV